MSDRPEHIPDGDPCSRCGLAEYKHRKRNRPEHAPEGDPCTRPMVRPDGTYACGQPAHVHRPDERREGKRERDKGRSRQVERRIVGIDGEGIDVVRHGVKRHLYTYLAAVDEHGVTVSEARNPRGLTHDECMAMLGRIPKNTLKFGFMFSYDITKIIESMPAALRYYLMRPEIRVAVRCVACGEKLGEPGTAKACECGDERTRETFEPVWWQGRGYDYFAGSFSVIGKRGKKPPGQVCAPKRRSVKVWDCFRFFGTSFVNAIEDWKIGEPDEVAFIRAMKEKRGSFTNETADEVERYCRRECHLLALLMRKVIVSHEAAGIPLKRFEGAGSTASALLTKYNVQEYRGDPLEELPAGLAFAIECAFFGGRFENSLIGEVTEPMWSYDISSAYPYAQAAHLACLKCGSWRYIRGSASEIRARCERSDHAVVRFRVGSLDARARRELAWGPLPCRTEDGSIVYGLGFSGWAWKEELFPILDANLWRALVDIEGEAWIYRTKCDHRPFAYVPGAYRKRCEWGKEGPGKCMKLGLNAGYGKTAQRKGRRPPFRCPAWAGITTGTTRGQLADAIARARDPWSVASTATDGIYGVERLSLPKPEHTGTEDLPKPLGGWEEKLIEEGCFFVKPGLYFRRGVSDASEIRARGVGRKEVLRDADRLRAAFADWDRKDFRHSVSLLSRRFWGAKHSNVALSRCTGCKKSWPGVPEKMCPSCGQIGNVFRVSPVLDDKGRSVYGSWSERDVEIRFDPWPKRERELGKGGTFSRLSLRDLGGVSSMPYSGRATPEGEASRLEREIALERPDWDDAD
jgi:hypothetical protein